MRFALICYLPEEIRSEEWFLRWQDTTDDEGRHSEMNSKVHRRPPPRQLPVTMHTWRSISRIMENESFDASQLDFLTWSSSEAPPVKVRQPLTAIISAAGTSAWQPIVSDV